MRQNVLVTGGAGYVGCVLVPRLVEQDYNVRVLDKMYFGAEGLEPVKEQIEIVAGDVRDVSPEVLDGIDAVVHLAGLSNDPTAEYNPKANRSINTEGTLRMARMCKENGVNRFIFASSCSVYYTPEPDDTVRDEEYPVAPEAPYSRSKHQAELGLRELADEDFHPVMLRKGTIYGASPRMRYDLVVNTFVKDVFERRCLVIHAGGRMWRPMLHIDDACDAYIACIEAPDSICEGDVYNILQDNYRVIDIAREVRRALETRKGVRVDMEVQQVGAIRSYRVSGGKARDVLGLEFDRTISGAVAQIWDDLEEGIDYDLPIYYNIRWLEWLDEMQHRLEVMGGRVF
jgi:nucleoside-diphosphate-sugar epimerase